MSSRLSWFSGKQRHYFPVNTVMMPWWITYMEIKRNISQWWKIRYLHKLKYAFSFLLCVISSLKHLPTGHLVVLMEKMKYVLLKIQSTEKGQFKGYSSHLPEVLRHQNKTVCLFCATPALRTPRWAPRWAGMSKTRVRLIKIKCGMPTLLHPSLQDARHRAGLLACIFLSTY